MIKFRDFHRLLLCTEAAGWYDIKKAAYISAILTANPAKIEYGRPREDHRDILVRLFPGVEKFLEDESKLEVFAYNHGLVRLVILDREIFYTTVGGRDYLNHSQIDLLEDLCFNPEKSRKLYHDLGGNKQKLILDPDVVKEGLGNKIGAVAAGLMLGSTAVAAPHATQHIGHHTNTTAQVERQEDTRPRGIRNNNPGNIRIGQQWLGASKTNDGSFVRFTSPQYGIRAIARTLKTYTVNYKLNSVKDIISRWSPSTENNTAAYISFVSKAVGVKPEDVLDMFDDKGRISDEGKLTAFVRAIIQFENSQCPYDTNTIRSSIRLAQ